MIYFTMMCLTTFVLSLVSFIAYNTKSFHVDDGETLSYALLTSFVCGALWIITIPVIVIVAAAWFTAKKITKN